MVSRIFIFRINLFRRFLIRKAFRPDVSRVHRSHVLEGFEKGLRRSFEGESQLWVSRRGFPLKRAHFYKLCRVLILLWPWSLLSNYARPRGAAMMPRNFIRPSFRVSQKERRDGREMARESRSLLRSSSPLEPGPPSVDWITIRDVISDILYSANG